MAEHADDPAVLIIEPKERSVLPIENLHIPKRLKKTIRQQRFEVTFNTRFSDVIEACSHTTNKRHDTWINQSIKDVFNELHVMGHAHSVECWNNSKLVGGLYGLQLGSAFCGESMFSRETDASKVTFIYLSARLWKQGFKLLDAQFPNEHLNQFGQKIIPQSEYVRCLQAAMAVQAEFNMAGSPYHDVLDYLLFRKVGEPERGDYQPAPHQ